MKPRNEACSNDSSSQLLYSPVNGAAAFVRRTATCRKLIGRVADPAESTTTEGLIHGPAVGRSPSDSPPGGLCPCLVVVVVVIFVPERASPRRRHRPRRRLEMLGFQCFVVIMTNERTFLILVSETGSSSRVVRRTYMYLSNY